MTRSASPDILNALIELIAASGKRAAADIVEDTQLADLGLASLDVLDLVFQVESRLGVQIPDSVASDLGNKTVGDLAVLVAAIKDGSWSPPASS